MPIRDPEKRREYQAPIHESLVCEEFPSLRIDRNLKRRKMIQAWFAELKASLHAPTVARTIRSVSNFHHPR